MTCRHFITLLSQVGEHKVPVDHCLGMKNMPTVKCEGCLTKCENEHMKEKIKEQSKDCNIYDVKIIKSDLTVVEKTIAVPVEEELIAEFTYLVDELQYNIATEINIKRRCDT